MEKKLTSSIIKRFTKESNLRGEFIGKWKKELSDFFSELERGPDPEPQLASLEKWELEINEFFASTVGPVFEEITNGFTNLGMRINRRKTTGGPPLGRIGERITILSKDKERFVYEISIEPFTPTPRAKNISWNIWQRGPSTWSSFANDFREITKGLLTEQFIDRYRDSFRKKKQK